MGYRCTDGDIRAICETNSSVSLIPFIEVANEMTTYVSSKDTSSELTVTMLKKIEIYLAAFFYTLKDPTYSSRSTGGASGSFKGQSGMIFEQNEYGQIAMALDITGTLAQLNKNAKEGKPRASLSWGGTDDDIGNCTCEDDD